MEKCVVCGTESQFMEPTCKDCLKDTFWTRARADSRALSINDFRRLREIAEGQSPQFRQAPPSAACSFCGKRSNQVRALLSIGAPDAICNDCVAECCAKFLELASGLKEEWFRWRPV